jgi:hypothetical protein
MIAHREINISGVCFEPAFTGNIDIKFTVYHVHELTPRCKTFPASTKFSGSLILSNETSGPTQGGKILEELSHRQHVKKQSAA